jgi:hypothetical protein
MLGPKKCRLANLFFYSFTILKWKHKVAFNLLYLCIITLSIRSETSWQFIPSNQLAIYVFLVLLLWCWSITNVAAKGLVEQLYSCLLLSKPKSYFQHQFFFISRLSHWDWKVSLALSTFSALICLSSVLVFRQIKSLWEINSDYQKERKVANI